MKNIKSTFDIYKLKKQFEVYRNSAYIKFGATKIFIIMEDDENNIVSRSLGYHDDSDLIRSIYTAMGNIKISLWRRLINYCFGMSKPEIILNEKKQKG